MTFSPPKVLNDATGMATESTRSKMGAGDLFTERFMRVLAKENQALAQVLTVQA